MNAPDNRRSPIARGMQKASQITTMSLTLVLPAAGGYFADLRFGTSPLFMILGTLVGMAAGGWQLYKLAADQNVDSD